MSLTTNTTPPSLARATAWRFAAVVISAALLLGVVVAVLYLQDRRHQVATTKQQAEDLVERQEQFFTQDLDSVKSDLLYLAQQHALKELLAGNDSVRDPLEDEYVQFAKRKGVYDQIRCLDTTGREVIRINYRPSADSGEDEDVAQIVSIEDLQDKTGRYYFRQAMLLTAGEVFVSPLDLNVEHGEIETPHKPVIRFLTPVFDAEGRKRGLLVLNYLGDHLLRKSAEISQTGPGAMMLLNSQGEYLQGVDEEDAWGWMLGHQHNFPADHPQAWERIEGQDEGQFYLPGDGLYTYRRIRQVEHVAPPEQLAEDDGEESQLDSDLVLVSRVPTSELYAASHKLLQQLLLLYVGAMLLVLVIGWYWARAAAVRTSQRQRLAASEKRLRLLSAQLLAAQEDERRRISRELHDGLGQLLTAVRLDLKSAASHELPQRTRELLQRGVEEIDQLLASVHDIAGRLRPSVLDDLGLRDAVESYLETYQQRSGIQVNADLMLNGRPVPKVVGENIYRILQEALTNVARHAQSEQVWVELAADQQVLSLSVRDEGVGFDPAGLEGSRLGVLGMQERAELLHGEMELKSAPGEGAHLQFRIPLNNDHN